MSGSSQVYPMGRVEIIDPRDANYPLTLALGAPPTVTTRYWPLWSAPILDQRAPICAAGPMRYQNWCVGASCRNFLCAAPLTTKGGPTACDIYQRALVLDDYPDWPGSPPADTGTSIRAGLKVLQQEGHLGSYLWARDIQEIKAWILTQGTVIVGTQWLSGMNAPGEDGVLNMSGQVLGGHAYLVVGYSAARDAFRIVNSWGRKWGQNGRAWMRSHDLGMLLMSHGEAVTAVELKVVPS